MPDPTSWLFPYSSVLYFTAANSLVFSLVFSYRNSLVFTESFALQECSGFLRKNITHTCNYRAPSDYFWRVVTTLWRVKTTLWDMWMNLNMGFRKKFKTFLSIVNYNSYSYVWEITK